MRANITCREFVDFLMDHLEGSLDADVRSIFEGHMDDCPGCVTYLDTYRATVALGKQILCDDPDGPVPADVPDELVQAILAARSG